MFTHELQCYNLWYYCASILITKNSIWVIDKNKCNSLYFLPLILDTVLGPRAKVWTIKKLHHPRIIALKYHIWQMVNQRSGHFFPISIWQMLNPSLGTIIDSGGPSYMTFWIYNIGKWLQGNLMSFSIDVHEKSF